MPIPLGILAVAGAGAAGGGSFDLLETTVLSTATLSVTFSSLDTYSQYKHLQIRATFKNNGTGGAEGFMRINGITTNSYAWHYLRGGGSSVNSGAFSTTNYMGLMSNTGFTANQFNAAVIDILDFSSTSKNKTVRSFVGGTDSGGYREIGIYSGFYNSTNAITSFRLQMPDNFSAGSRFSLYGIK